jgi:hypothetical protein
MTLGMLAVWSGSDLDVPPPLPKCLALYLLLAIGFRGGVELHQSGLDGPACAFEQKVTVLTGRLSSRCLAW